MKKFRKLLIAAITLSVMMTSMVFTVFADTTTDLSSMKVYGLDASGGKTEVPMNFNSTTYTYDLTVKSDIVSIEIEAEAADATSKWVVEKQGINTKMDTGNNLTVVAVTSKTGSVQKYTLNTKKLTTAEEATYKAPDNNNDDDNSAKKNDGDTTVKVGKKSMKISSSFSKSSIPEGFKKSSQKYAGKKYNCIKGEVKDLTAFYLYNSKTEGFYIYDQEKDEFYAMNNIKIKSRMYTIINPDKTDGILESYDQKKVTIIDTKVDAWALDEEEGMYLVYAMNWNGEKNLYCYDDNEKCFQRYLVSNDANNQSEAAAKAYNNLQKDYNKLVDKYNVLIKILCVLVVLIIVLVFVIINLALNKKEKKIKKSKDGKYIAEDEVNFDEAVIKEKKKSKKRSEKESEGDAEDEDDIDSGIEIGSNVQEEKDAEDSNDNNDDVEQIEREVQKEIADEIAKQSEDKEDEQLETEPKRKKDSAVVRAYGDEPTFGTDRQSEEGFYGGEIEDEDEIFIDIVDNDEKTDSSKEEDREDEDLKKTIKSLLPDDKEDEDDEDDFEFIDLD